MRTRCHNEARQFKTHLERAYQNLPEETVSKGWLKEALNQCHREVYPETVIKQCTHEARQIKTWITHKPQNEVA